MKRMIIAAERATAEQSNAITIHLRAKGWHFWHWLEDVWLLAEVPAEVTPRIVWDEIAGLPLFGRLRCVVLQVDPTPAYWGQCNPESWVWLERFWSSGPT